jgi:hypothetical protein
LKNDPNNSSTELFQNNVLESNLGESFVILDDDIEGNRSYDLKETTTLPPVINKSTKLSDRPGGAITNTDIRLDDIQFPTIQLSPQFWTHILSWAGSLQSQTDGKGEHNVETFSPRLTEGSLTWNDSSQFGEPIRSLGQSVISTTAHDELLNSTFQKIQNTEVKSYSDGVLRLLQVVKTLSKAYMTKRLSDFKIGVRISR